MKPTNRARFYQIANSPWTAVAVWGFIVAVAAHFAYYWVWG